MSNASTTGGASAPRLADTLWRMVQSARLNAKERAFAQRAFQVLEHAGDPKLLERRSTRVAYLPGETIVNVGDASQELFLLLDGVVQVVREGVVVETLHRGGLFGEIALLEGTPRSATVRAADRVVVLRIPADVVDDPMRERLWDYAVERLFANLAGGPVTDPEARQAWFMVGRHLVLSRGEYPLSNAWIFLAHGRMELDGALVEGPVLLRGGTARIHDAVRLVLLDEPE